jgi:hypothetical protein
VPERSRRPHHHGTRPLAPPSRPHLKSSALVAQASRLHGSPSIPVHPTHHARGTRTPPSTRIFFLSRVRHELPESRVLTRGSALTRTSHRESESVYLGGENSENSDSGGDLQTQALQE